MLIFNYFNIPHLLIIISIFHVGFIASVVASQDEITITQSMPSSALPGTEFTVELFIKKGSITGFAKVQQELPPGFTATAIETYQSNFSFNDQVVKFIWKSLPEESEFQLSYRVAVSANQVSGTNTIGGMFAYLENNERMVVDIPPGDIFISAVETAEVNTREVETPNLVVSEAEPLGASPEIPTEETIKEITTEVKEPSEFTNEPEETPVSEIPVKPTPAKTVLPAKSNVEYKIQIAAAYKEIPTAHFLGKYNITEQIEREVHNEMNKYTVGSFSNYDSALKHLAFIRNNKGVEGAFVTAYKNGKRITIEEAHRIVAQID